ncbi:MAG: cytochrome P450 [Deltaproteobacteria bacterium]|nr:cytochrome P450 [Deltaproteobacteria bacterium]
MSAAPTTTGPEAPFIDTLSAEYDSDIHAAHRRARESAFYARTPLGLIFLDYEAVHWLLHERRFRLQGNDALDLAGIPAGPLRDWFGKILSNKEGAPHQRLRRLVSRAFTPRQIDRLRPMMRATAQEFIDSLAERHASEFVEDFAAPYPVRVIGSLLGVPASDFARFHAWSRDLSLAFGSRIASERPRIEAALGNLCDYADGLVARLRRKPGEDLTSALIALESAGGEFLDPDELRAMITVLIFGGQDTTQCQIACSIATFARHPDAWHFLAAHPEHAMRAAEECLRFEGSGSGNPRTALEDIDYRGLHIPAGTVVLPSAPAANRDPKVYPDPDRFDLLREHDQPQLTFGGGVHFCLGASLARFEIGEVLPMLAKRIPELALDGPIEWRRGSLIRGPERLPITF